MRLKAITGNVIIKVDMKQKERHAIGNGNLLKIERGYNFNLREDNPSMGEIVDAEKIPIGATCLFHHNATQPSQQIYDAIETNPNVKIFSVSTDMVFLFKIDGGEWQPNDGFLITKRIFNFYTGMLVGIQSPIVDNRMYVVKGCVDGQDLSGLACVTLVNCDYEIIFQENDKPTSIIRTREREILAIDYGLTERINNNQLLIGESPANAKIITQLNHKQQKADSTKEINQQISRIA